MSLVEFLDTYKNKNYVIPAVVKGKETFLYSTLEDDKEEISKLYNKRIKSIAIENMNQLPPNSEPLLRIDLE